MPPWIFEELWLRLWLIYRRISTNSFPIHEHIKQFWDPQIFKLIKILQIGFHLKLTVTLSLLYLFDWKLAHLNFFKFVRQNLRAQKIGFVLQILWAQAYPITIGRAISPDLKMWHKHHSVIRAQTCIFGKTFHPSASEYRTHW